MSNQRRIALIAAAIAVIVVAAVVASSVGGSSDKKAATAATVTVQGGRPVGGVQKVTFKKGGTIDLTIRSDVADEVHFHGYDVHRDVTAGGSVRFKFPATVEGRFVVEFEKRGEQLAEVTVEP